jgi:SpoVK/Ycf46/Vps4 family AAA+-type ATPase
LPGPTTVHDLRTLILSFHPLIAIDTLEEQRARELLRAAARDLGMPLFEWTVTRGLYQDPDGRPIHGSTKPVTLLQHLGGLTLEAIFWLHDLPRFLDDPGVARELRELMAQFAGTRSALVVAGDPGSLPRDVQRQSAYLRLELPSREELRRVVSSVCRSFRTRNPIPVELSPEDLERLLDALRGMTANQARQVVAYAALSDGRFSADNIRTVQERKARLLQESGALEYFPAEDNPFELGGFQRLKSWLERAQVGFGPEARALSLPAPRGVLLVGVQGCGKSLAAKVIARSWGLPLLKLDAGLLYDKYLGASEKNFRRAVEVAEAMAPCLLWIDEIEKGFAQNSPGESDGGVSRRLFGALLTWMQERRADVFLVATSNDVFGLPPELLRKGRFDEIFFVDLPDPEDREAIFRIHLQRHKQKPDRVHLGQLVDSTDGFSGAEIEQAVVAALYRALHERKPLETSLLLAEIEGTLPLSVSRREDVTRLREIARERFVPVK